MKCWFSFVLIFSKCGRPSANTSVLTMLRGVMCVKQDALLEVFLHCKKSVSLNGLTQRWSATVCQMLLIWRNVCRLWFAFKYWSPWCLFGKANISEETSTCQGLKLKCVFVLLCPGWMNGLETHVFPSFFWWWETLQLKGILQMNFFFVLSLEIKTLVVAIALEAWSLHTSLQREEETTQPVSGTAWWWIGCATQRLRTKRGRAGCSF